MSVAKALTSLAGSLRRLRGSQAKVNPDDVECRVADKEPPKAATPVATCAADDASAAQLLQQRLPAWASFTNEDIIIQGGCLGLRLAGLDGPAQCCAFSASGAQLAVGGSALDPRVLIIDVCSGRVLWELEGHSNAISQLAFCRGHTGLVSCVADEAECRLWDVSTGKLLKVFTHDGPLAGMAVSPDGKLLACNVKEAGQLVVWSLEGPKYEQVMLVSTGSTNSWCIPCFSPDSITVASECKAPVEDYTISCGTIWSIATAAVVTELRAEVIDDIRRIQFAASGTRICVNDCNFTLIWSLETSTGGAPTLLQRVRHRPLNAGIGVPSFSPDSSMMVVVEEASAAVHPVLSKMWQQPVRVPLVCAPLAHPSNPDYTSCIRWSPCGTMLLTGDCDGGCFIWSTESWSMLWDLSSCSTRAKQPETEHEPVPHQNAVQDAAFSPDSRSVVLVYRKGPPVLICMESPCPQVVTWQGRDRDLRDHPELTNRFARDGTVLAAQAYTADKLGMQLQLCSTATGQVVNSVALPGVVGWDAEIAVSADGTVAVHSPIRISDAAKCGIMLWHVHSKTPREELQEIPRELLVPNCHVLALSPDGSVLVVFGYHSGKWPFQVWSVADVKVVHERNAMDLAPPADIITEVAKDAFINRVTFTPDGRQLILFTPGCTTGFMRLDARTWTAFPLSQASVAMRCMDTKEGTKAESRLWTVCDVAVSHDQDSTAVVYMDWDTSEVQAAAYDNSSGECTWMVRYPTQANRYISMSWAPNDSFLLLAVPEGLCLLDARDGTIQRRIRAPPCGLAYMTSDGRTIVGIHEIGCADSLMSSGPTTLTSQGLVVSTITPFALEGVVPDCDRVRFLRSNQQLPEPHPTVAKMLSLFPSLLHHRDWKGTTLPAMALQLRDSKLLQACIEAAPEGSHAVRWQPASSPKNAAVLDIVSSSRTDMMKQLLQALASRKLMGCMDDHSGIAYPILEWALTHDPAVCLQYLRNILHTCQLTYPLRQESQSMCVGISNHATRVPAILQWKNGEGSMRLVDARLDKNEHAVQACTVPWKDAAVIDSGQARTLVRAIIRTDVSSSFFQVDSVRAILEAKWGMYGRHMVVQQLLLHLLLVALFSAFCLLLPSTLLPEVAAARQQLQWSPKLRAASWLLGASALLMARNCFDEINQWYAEGIQAAAGSMWNIIDVVSCAAFAAAAIIFWSALALPAWRCQAAMQALQVLAATESIVLWSRVLHYMCAFRSTGPMVRMVIAIVRDMRYFLVLLACLAAGFGVAFHLLFWKAATGTSSAREAFSTIPRTMVTMLSIMVGGFDQGMFFEADVAWLAVLLFTAYVLVMLVVLFNLLIAIMGDSFEKVKDTEENEFLKGRAEVLLEIECMQMSRTRTAVSQQVAGYVHFLRPQQAEGDNDAMGAAAEWQGKLKEAERRHKAQLDTLRAELLDSLAARLDAAVGSLSSQLNQLSDATATRDRRLDLVVAALGHREAVDCD